MYTQMYPQALATRAAPQVLTGGTVVAAAPHVAAIPSRPPVAAQRSTVTVTPGNDFHEQPVNENVDELRLVSLGCYCGPKLSFRGLKRDAETLPFDWVRTRIDGLLHFIQNDFDKFFDYQVREVVPGAGIDKPMITHRSYYHSFWHDDLSDEATFAKYRRRMDRFKAIDAHNLPVLFVRSVATTEEIQHTEKLYGELLQRFGRCAKLLLIVDFQPADEHILVNGLDNLLIAKLHHSAHGGDNGGAPYAKAIGVAIEWAKSGKLLGDVPSKNVTSISMVNETPTDWGLKGLGGLPAFERQPCCGMVPLNYEPQSAVPAATIAAPSTQGPAQFIAGGASMQMNGSVQGAAVHGASNGRTTNLITTGHPGMRLPSAMGSVPPVFGTAQAAPAMVAYANQVPRYIPATNTGAAGTAQALPAMGAYATAAPRYAPLSGFGAMRPVQLPQPYRGI